MEGADPRRQGLPTETSPCGLPRAGRVPHQVLYLINENMVLLVFEIALALAAANQFSFGTFTDDNLGNP